MERLVRPHADHRGALDDGRKRVRAGNSAVQVDRIPSSVFLDGLGVLVNGVCRQVLEFQSTSVQHRDSSTATAVRRVCAFGVAWIHTRFVAEERDQAPVQEGDAHAFTAVNKQQLSKFTILLVVEG